MRESSFTDLIPLWRTLREEGVTCLVTPALDYVGALEIGTLDVRFANDDAIAGIGEGLRQLVSGLDDGTILHFLYRVELGGAEEDIREYESLCAGEGKSPALAAYVAGRGAWLRRQPLRKARVYLFFSETSLTAASLTRGLLGAPLVFGNTAKFTQAHHVARLQRLAQLRDRLLARLTSVGRPRARARPRRLVAPALPAPQPESEQDRRAASRVAARQPLRFRHHQGDRAARRRVHGGGAALQRGPRGGPGPLPAGEHLPPRCHAQDPPGGRHELLRNRGLPRGAPRRTRGPSPTRSRSPSR